MNFTGQVLKRYQINNESQVIEYEVVHRPKVTRCIHLELAEHGALQVVAPRRMSKRLIQSTMQEWATYVSQFLAKARARQQEIPELMYTTGERHLYNGQRYPLNIQGSSGKRFSVELIEEKIHISAPVRDRDSIRLALRNWYRKQATRHFAHRMTEISRFAPWTKGKQPEMRLRQMKRTWGSCSVAGAITLNPHLIKAPLDCIDYVVAHEICHLREHNHGKAFYVLQEQLFPGWREARDHLQHQAHVYLHV